jgi:hypothetical protein
LKNFGANQTLIQSQPTARRRIKKPTKMCTLSRRIENSRVLSCFNSDDLLTLSNNIQLRHTEWTSIMTLTRNNRRVRNHSWLFKVFFTTLVGATEFFLRTVRKKTHPTFPQEILVSQRLINLADRHQTNGPALHIYIKEKGMEPRAGFDPAACCLRGSRSTRLSHRGTKTLNKETPIFKSSQTQT